MRLIPGGAFHKSVDLNQVEEILSLLERECGQKDVSDEIPAMPGTPARTLSRKVYFSDKYRKCYAAHILNEADVT